MKDSTITAQRAVQMSEALKHGPCTLASLAALTNLAPPSIERWLWSLQHPLIGAVRACSMAGNKSRYEWVKATETRVLALGHEIARHQRAAA